MRKGGKIDSASTLDPAKRRVLTFSFFFSPL